MNYDDIETFKNINRDNNKLSNTIDNLTQRLEKLANNANIKYLNFKVIGISALIGLIVGASAVSGFAYYQIKTQKPIEIVKVDTKLQDELDFYLRRDAGMQKVIKDKEKKLKELTATVQTQKNRIEKMKNKILPSDYYCSDSEGNSYICINSDDDRFSKEEKIKQVNDYSNHYMTTSLTTYYIELK